MKPYLRKLSSILHLAHDLFDVIISNPQNLDVLTYDSASGKWKNHLNAGGSIEVKEVDGAPDVTGVSKIVVSNGSLTDNGGGQVTLVTGGGSLEVKEADGAPDVTGVTLISVTNGKLTDNGGGSVSLDLSGSGGSDTSAIHTNISAEISTITEKTVPVSADLLVIEDSAASNAKKKVQVGNLDYRPYLDSGIPLIATYGDDFNGSSLNARWTRHNILAGAETYQAGGGSWLQVALTNSAADKQYHQTAPAGDFEIVMSFMQYYANNATMMGPCVIDSSGNGVAAFFYSNANLFYVGILSAYAYSSFNNTIAIATQAYYETAKVWIGLRKVGSNYSARFSYNGYIWSDYTANQAKTMTVDRIGFGRYLTAAAQTLAIDKFNLI